MMNRVQRLYRLLIAAGSSLQSPFLLAVRLYWGWQFAQTGWGKLNNLERVTGFFTSLGIPFPALNAAFIGTLEFSGGILLALGLGSRLISLLLTGSMLVAFVTRRPRRSILNILRAWQVLRRHFRIRTCSPC